MDDIKEKERVPNVLERIRRKACTVGVMLCSIFSANTEIKQLRTALLIAAGKLSTLPPYTELNPDVIYKALLEDGTEEARRG